LASPYEKALTRGRLSERYMRIEDAF